MSISACPSILPLSPFSDCERASIISLRDKNILKSSAIITTINGPPRNSAAANCQPIKTMMMIVSSATRFVDASWKAIAAVKFAPLRKIGAVGKSGGRQGHRRERTGRRRCPQAAGNREGFRRIVRQQFCHFTFGNDCLHRRRQAEAKDERPKNFPKHGERHPERVANS